MTAATKKTSEVIVVDQQVVCPRRELLAALDRVRGAIPKSRGTLPILGNVKFEYTPPTPEQRKAKSVGLLTLEATNLDVMVHTRVPLSDWIDPQEPFAFTVPCKLLVDTLKGVRDAEVHLCWYTKVRSLKVVFNGGSSVIKGISAEEFPIIAQDLFVPDNLVGFLDKEWFPDIMHVNSAASDDDSRPVLASVYVGTNQADTDLDEGVGTIQFVAADGFRLHMMERFSNVSQNFKLLIPKKSVPFLKYMQSNVALYMNRTQVGWTDMMGTKVVSRLVEGNYVDWKRVVPVDHKTHIRISSVYLHDALKQLAVYAKDSANIVKLEATFDDEEGTIPADTWAAGTLHLTSNAAELGDVTREVPCEIRGEATGIALNVHFLIDITAYLGKTWPSGMVDIKLKTPGSPCLITYADKFTYVVMPMYLANR